MNQTVAARNCGSRTWIRRTIAANAATYRCIAISGRTDCNARAQVNMSSCWFETYSNRHSNMRSSSSALHVGTVFKVVVSICKHISSWLWIAVLFNFQFSQSQCMRRYSCVVQQMSAELQLENVISFPVHCAVWAEGLPLLCLAFHTRITDYPSNPFSFTSVQYAVQLFCKKSEE